MQKKVRKFNIAIGVMVDDAKKPEYESAMDELCTHTFNELRAILRSMDRGTGRVSVDIKRLEEDEAPKS